jgi:SpoIIAA-like
MFEPIVGAPDGVLAFRAVGHVESSDYEQVLTPAIEAATEAHGKVRIVLELGQEYEGYSAGAAWEDVKLWAPRLTSWERCAVVTDHKLLGDTIKLFAHIMPGEVQVFSTSELDDALAWAAA